MNTHYKTIIVSDLHLGIKSSRARELVRFLNQMSCEHLILNGDIVDGWQLRKGGKWKKKHTRFFQTIIKKIERTDMKVTYLMGNHDDFLNQVMPFQLGRFSIQKEAVLYRGSKKYLVIHGDIFDQITTKLKWLAHLGDYGYNLLLYFNRLYNYKRLKQGKPYYSLSQKVKSSMKTANNYIGDYENTLTDYAKKRGFDGIICGHIHQAAIRKLGEIIYMNSGDWVESMSALVEDDDGEWSLIYYSESSYTTQSETSTNPEIIKTKPTVENSSFIRDFFYNSAIFGDDLEPLK
ncbi:MAG: UDP-2,3-diacylglucosamine diphosphatase [Cyclobacteriaceae bacterium]|nr:UDP-2,3-diacylglucosamine diphosphatase [Cyclobacteriaceae bacterium]